MPPIILTLCLVLAGGVSGILNHQTGSCSSDEDCSLRETFLYCINQRCQCLQGGATTVHGVRVQLTMEWDAYRSKCVSLPGSLCTFKVRQPKNYRNNQHVPLLISILLLRIVGILLPTRQNWNVPKILAVSHTQLRVQIRKNKVDFNSRTLPRRKLISEFVGGISRVKGLTQGLGVGVRLHFILF